MAISAAQILVILVDCSKNAKQRYISDSRNKHMRKQKVSVMRVSNIFYRTLSSKTNKTNEKSFSVF